MRLQAVPLLVALGLFATACPPPTPAPTPDPSKSDVTVDRATGVAADGSDHATITVTVKDTAGNPVSGVLVQLAATGTGNTLAQPPATDANGATTATIASTVAETKTITATIAQGQIPRQPTVGFVAGAVSPTTSTVTAIPSSVTADGVASTTITVTVRDARNNPVAGQPVTLSATGSQNTLVQPGTTDASGVATGSLKSTRAEVKTLTATAGSTPLLQQPIVQFVPGAAAQLAFAVPPSNAGVAATIVPAVQVAIQDAQGNLVASSTATVTLALGTNPSGGTLNGTRTVAAVNGVATFSNLSLSRAGTGYTLVASAAGLTSATSSAFDITAAGGLSHLTFRVGPSNAAAGAAISPAIQVSLEDASGNIISGATDAVTLTLGSGAGGTLSGTTTVAAVNGVATFSNLSIDRAGSGYTLIATASGYVGTTSGAFSISAGPAARLAFTAQPSNVTAGSAISPAIQVAVQDAVGNVLGSDTRAITLALGSNPGSGTLSGTLTVNAVGGVATFSGISLDKTGTGYTLTASATGVSGAMSTAFNVTPGAASRLAFTVQPSNGVSGAALSPAVQITIQDAAGNTVTNATHPVSVALTGGTAGATLSGSVLVGAVNGVATFSDLRVDKAGSGYALSATSAGLVGAVSSTFSIGAGPASQLVFTSQPTNGTSGVPLAAVRVTIQDAAGNTITGATTPVTLTLSGGTVGATLSGTTTATPSSGIASFADLSVDKAGIGYTLTAAATGLSSATSQTFRIDPGPARKLVFTAQPQDGSSSVALPAVQVAIQDAAGNTVTTATDAVTVTLGGGTAGATLAGTTTVSAVAGVARFANLSVDKSGTGYTLSASAAGLSGATSSAFSISPGPASRLVFTAQPGDTVAGQTFRTVTVTVQDAAGNTVTSSTLAITLGLATGPTGGTLGGTTSASASGGVATFSDLRITQAGTGYSLSASATGVTSATSNTFSISAGPPAKLVFGQQPSNTNHDTAITPPPTVLIQDTYGNATTSATNTVSLSIGTNPGGGTLGGTTSVAAVAGVAAFANVSISRPGAGYTLVATSTGLTSATSATFNILLGPITGTRIGHYITDTATIDRPDDLSPAGTIGAYVAQADGGVTFYPGTGTITGTFSIPNVPIGPYVLKFRTDHIDTSTRTLDLGFYDQGRPDVARADAGTYQHTLLSNMNPWYDDGTGVTDDLQMYSSNAGHWVSGLQYMDGDGGTATPGATTFDQWTDYDLIAQNGYIPKMVDASKGDRTTFNQLITMNPPPTDGGSGPLTYQAIARSFTTSSLTVRDGTAVTVSGSMTPVPMSNNLPVNWKLADTTPGSFGAFRTAVNPTATVAFTEFFLDVIPTSAYGFYSSTPDLVSHVELWSTPPDDESVTLFYGNPFPTTWARFADALVTYRVRYTLPKPGGGTSTTSDTVSSIAVLDLLPSFPASSLQPQISPVQNPLINGVSAFTAQTIGPMPTISWSAPAVGTPTSYSVRFRELYVDAGGIARRGNYVGRVVTTATSVRVPPNILQSGKMYYMRITARQEPGSTIGSAPYYFHWPSHTADAISALLTVN